MVRSFLVVAALAALSACSTEPMRGVRDIFQPAAGRAALATGLQQYEDGDYAGASKNLQGALDQGLDDEDRISAHKYLAFINCVWNRTRQCRDEFRKALAVNPKMELEPAEAGHPVWGPVFRSLKTSR